MGRVYYQSTGIAYQVVEPCGQDEADIGIDLYASTVGEAVDRIRASSANFDGVDAIVEAVPFSDGKTLLLVRDTHMPEHDPLLLIFEHDGPSDDDDNEE